MKCGDTELCSISRGKWGKWALWLRAGGEFSETVNFWYIFEEYECMRFLREEDTGSVGMCQQPEKSENLFCKYCKSVVFLLCLKSAIDVLISSHV